MGHPYNFGGSVWGERHREAPRDFPASPTAPKPRIQTFAMNLSEPPKRMSHLLAGRARNFHINRLDGQRPDSAHTLSGRKKHYISPNKTETPLPGAPTWRGMGTGPHRLQTLGYSHTPKDPTVPNMLRRSNLLSP